MTPMADDTPELILADLFSDVGGALTRAGIRMRSLPHLPYPPTDGGDGGAPDTDPDIPAIPEQWPTQGERVLTMGPIFAESRPLGVATGKPFGHMYASVDGTANKATRPQGQYSSGWADPVLIAKEENTGRLYLDHTLSLEGAPLGRSATTHQDQHIPFPSSPVEDIEHIQEFMFVDTSESPWDWGKTLKIGGVVGFNDGDWGNWPGGSAGGRQNASVRTVCSRYFPGDELPANPPQPRLEAYCYIGGGIDNVTKPPAWTRDIETGINAAWTLWPDPPLNRWIQVRYTILGNNVGRPDGALIVDARAADEDGIYRSEMATVVNVDGIEWFAEGPGKWNRTYMSVMFGGSTADFAPYTPSRSARIRTGYHETRSLD